MATDSKQFGGRFEPQKGSLKKDPSLPIYETFIRAKNKTIAKTLLHAEFLEFAPDYADDYFAPKVWEAVEGMFCSVEGQFYTDLFNDEIIWNAEKGEPERVLVEPELTENNSATEKMSVVRSLPTNYRADSLVLFGPAEEITATQYGQIMDLVNDEESSQARELAEAIVREPRVLELLPERQVELLVYLRDTASETAQWTDIKKLIVKWLDTPPVKRDQANTDDSEKQKSILLRYRIACGVIARSMDFDALSPPIGIEVRANSILTDKNDTEVTSWFVPLSRTPGVNDFHPAAIIAMIKTSDEKLHVYPGELRKYIDKCISDFDFLNPPEVVIDIACGRTSSPLPQAQNDAGESSGWSQSTDDQINADIDRTLAARASAEQQHDDRLPVCDREIEIAHVLNDLLSGRTDIMGKEEAEGVVTCTGHLIADVLPLLIIDIATTEFCLSPNFSDEEIHDVATTILDGWSDDAAIRQKTALDAIVEYRRPEPPKPVVIDSPVVTVRPKKEPEPTPTPTDEQSTLTYRQQLTIAALQGMCANPACCGAFDELPFTAMEMASRIINAESDSD